jgi:uncharacterized protein
LRIAATADVHVRVGDAGRLRALVEGAAREADVLALGGDLTDLGRLEEAQVLLEVLDRSPIPVVATLGNHDHEGGNAKEISLLLEESSVHLLDRSSVIVDGVGFSGVKGFCGGFGGNVANSFGDNLFKAWVTEGILEAGATVAFHGHAHRGPFRGETPNGVPVFNVSLPVLEHAGIGRPYHVVEM